MGLSQYNKKRDFSKTPEPKGKVTQQHSRLFVIQKHATSHLHYDFRIELQGVLLSWVVPKGPSLDPSVKRLAMQVEDHPIEYGSFEGSIPKGQYGGGTVMLWDRGGWEPLDEHPAKAYQKGHLRFNLHAEKLNGRWDLIRFKDEKHWFLIKHEDEYAKKQKDYDITEVLTQSVVTNSSIEDITEHRTQAWQGVRAQNVQQKKTKKQRIKKPIILLPENLVQSEFPDFIPPQLATLVDEPPVGSEWVHEIKFDGYRIVAYKKNKEVVLKSRNNEEWTQAFQPVADALSQLPVKQLVLDGEVVVLDKQGRSDFQLLQNSLKNEKDTPFVYFLFDLLYFEGHDLRGLALLERKAILENLLAGANPILHYSDHIIKAGSELFQHSCNHSLEGIVSKCTQGAYHSTRSKEWLKIKCVQRQEFVIGGYTPPQGGRSHFGSLFLGVYDNEGTLHYSGNAGTGFNEQTLQELYRLLQQHKTEINPFATKPPGAKTATWIDLTLVCEVEFTQWTKEGHVRHPSFKGMRLDKKASEVVREYETPLKDVKKEKKPPRQTMSKPTIKLTNPDKVLYSEDGITKKELLIYYETVSEYIMPYLSYRPLTLVRCPKEYSQCFYQRHYNKTTQNGLHPIEAPQDEAHEQYIYLNDVQGLLSLVQMGVLEIHPWGSTINHLEQPDVIVFDLDPAPDVPWKKVVQGANEVREHLMQYQLQSFVKSTGGKGLHVVVPILPEYEWEDVKQFSYVFVQFLERLKPKQYISTMTKAKRVGKIFIDYLRNQRTATAIGTYSTRARIHAPVSVPLSWDELSTHHEDNHYTIKTVPQRLKHLKNDPWQEFWHMKQSLRLDEL